jgi:ubiquitin carboxyl-terminal hydrolase 5/13
MGFSENGSKRAAVATQNVSADTAMEWVFAHMEDPDFNDPVGVDDLMSHAGTAAAGSTAAADGVITGGNTTAAASATTPESVTMLSSMGFSESQASVALRRSAGDVERAADWLFSHADDLEKAVGKALGELDGGGGDGGGTCVSSVGDSSAATPCVDGKGVFSLFGVVSHMVSISQ